MAKFKLQKSTKKKFLLTLSKQEADALYRLVLDTQDANKAMGGPVWRIFHALYEYESGKNKGLNLEKYILTDDDGEPLDNGIVLQKRKD